MYSEVSPAERPVIDPHLILDGYRQVRETPASPRYKTFLQGFLGEIVVGRYSVTITLKTGLELFPDLDTAIPVRRRRSTKGRSASAETLLFLAAEKGVCDFDEMQIAF